MAFESLPSVPLVLRRSHLHRFKLSFQIHKIVMTSSTPQSLYGSQKLVGYHLYQWNLSQTSKRMTSPSLLRSLPTPSLCCQIKKKDNDNKYTEKITQNRGLYSMRTFLPHLEGSQYLLVSILNLLRHLQKRDNYDLMRKIRQPLPM